MKKQKKVRKKQPSD